MKKKVLFLCTGNSCRSQMAEAIVNARLGETWEAVSAGPKPVGLVHPKVLAVLAEVGLFAMQNVGDGLVDIAHQNNPNCSGLGACT